MSRAVRIGALDRRITLQQRSSSKDSSGQQSQTWSDAFTCWAAIDPLSGRELQAAQAIVAETTHEVLIRYRSTVRPDMRVVYQTKVFDVLNVLDEGMQHRMLRMLCSEGLNQG